MKSLVIKCSIQTLILALLLASCSIEKKHYSSGYYVDWHNNKAHDLAIKEKNKIALDEKNSAGSLSKNDLELSHTKSVADNITKANNEISNNDFIINNNTSLKERKASKKNKIANNISPLKIEFKKGVKRIIDYQKTKGSSINGLALAGFIASLVGLILFGLLLGLAAIILSAIGLFKIKQDPINWSGKGFAIAGIIIGVLDIIGWIIFVTFFL